MLSDLKTIVEIIRDVVSGVGGFRSKKTRSEAILELLRLYFMLADVVEDGRSLLNAVGQNPRKTLAQVQATKASTLLGEWDRLIRRQALRLDNLGGRLLGQDVLSVVDPSLKKKLEKLVGSKFKRARSLHGIGAALVIYLMFGGVRDPEWQRNVVLSMYPSRTRVTIDVVAANEELNQLQDALNEFRTVCLRLATKEEILLLSKKARKQTQFDKS